jgi:hypothetical protein
VATVSQFLAQFPEFENTNTKRPALVPAFLAAAELEIDRTVWLAKGDQGQMYLAAHKLSTSPFGNNARTSGESSTYLIEYQRLVMQVSSGFRVA